jgi:hypothetical protein
MRTACSLTFPALYLNRCYETRESRKPHVSFIKIEAGASHNKEGAFRLNVSAPAALLRHLLSPHRAQPRSGSSAMIATSFFTARLALVSAFKWSSGPFFQSTRLPLPVPCDRTAIPWVGPRRPCCCLHGSQNVTLGLGERNGPPKPPLFSEAASGPARKPGGFLRVTAEVGRPKGYGVRVRWLTGSVRHQLRTWFAPASGQASTGSG